MYTTQITNHQPLLSFSGAQSSGKTTLLDILQEYNPNINFVPEVTRKIKREYNLPINENGSVITQALIIADHIKNVYQHYSQSDRPTILDRCILDGYVYTEWFNKYKDQPSWALDFASSTMIDLLPKYDIIFYTNPKDVAIEDDGERSVDVDFRDQIIKGFIDTISHSQYDVCSRLVQLNGSVEDRLHVIKETCDDVGLKIKIT
jgi:nicotinamide riboside kinase